MGKTFSEMTLHEIQAAMLRIVNGRADHPYLQRLSEEPTNVLQEMVESFPWVEEYCYLSVRDRLYVALAELELERRKRLEGSA